MTTTEDLYRHFVQERHAVWERRSLDLPAPWTEDEVLQSRKFTNVFRILDRGTQFLLRELASDELDERDTLFRCWLYRMSGRPEPWEVYREVHETGPLVDDLALLEPTWTAYRGELKGTRSGGRTDFERPIFTGAYRVNAMESLFPPGVDKLQRLCRLAKRVFRDDKLITAFLAAPSHAHRFELIRKLPAAGDFMGMQIVTDYAYSQYGDRSWEYEFVHPGPGAVLGSSQLGLPFKRALLLGGELDVSLTLPSGVRVRPSLMDLQNTLCEFSKYYRMREEGWKRYPWKPVHDLASEEPVYPSHWG